LSDSIYTRRASGDASSDYFSLVEEEDEGVDNQFILVNYTKNLGDFRGDGMVGLANQGLGEDKKGEFGENK
jgi:hypothetical protein